MQGTFEEIQSTDNEGTYIGLSMMGKRWGRGKQEFVNGNVYTGEWKIGRMSGFGIMQYGKSANFGLLCCADLIVKQPMEMFTKDFGSVDSATALETSRTGTASRLKAFFLTDLAVMAGSMWVIGNVTSKKAAEQ